MTGQSTGAVQIAENSCDYNGAFAFLRVSHKANICVKDNCTN